MTVEIDGTVKTPEVLFKSGKMSISGSSILEDPALFYKPLAELLENYKNRCGRITEIDLRFEYPNCSSTKSVDSLLGIFERFYDEDNGFSINWYYYDDDECMRETGYALKLLSRVPVNIIAVSSRNTPVIAGQP